MEKLPARRILEDDAAPLPAAVVPAWRLRRRRRVRAVAESLVDRLLEAYPRGQQNMRFDVNARVEVFLDQDEIEDEFYKELDQLKASAEPEEQKIAKVKQLALQLAQTRVSEQSRNGVEIGADLSLSDVNLDRIDWVALVTKEEEEEWTPPPAGTSGEAHS